MSLMSLQGMDPRVADRVLATAVLAIGNTNVESVPTDLAEAATAVISEARDRVASGSRSDDQKATDQVRSFLSREIERRLMAGRDSHAIENRLGREAKLPIGAYKIIAAKGFKRAFRSESLGFASRIIREAEVFHHVLNGPASAEDNRQWSFFARRIESVNRRRHYWAIVGADRIGDTLEVGSFWRVFPEVVDVKTVSSALDLLKRFVGAYGAPYKFEGAEFEGLVMGETIPHTSTEKLEIAVGGDDTHLEAIGRVEDGTVILDLAYAVDLKRYFADRTRHA